MGGVAIDPSQFTLQVKTPDRDFFRRLITMKRQAFGYCVQHGLGSNRAMKWTLRF